MITNAQKELLVSLENGYEVTFKDGHYMTVYEDKLSTAKLWPTTFYGLYDIGYVKRTKSGNYTISHLGKLAIEEQHGKA